MKLAKFPRLRITHGPTPLEPMKRLTEALGGPNLWIKRDDCTGLASGGNKTRKLEYLMAEALQLGADTVITQGATQSNHARQTVAIAAKLGLQSHIILEDRTGYTVDDYKHSGNVFLDHLYGASVSEVPANTDMNAAMATLAEQLREQGRKPYVIPGGGSNALGALGYVTCALELMDQANNQGLAIDSLVHATGSAGTQAGLVVGGATAICGASAALAIASVLPQREGHEQRTTLAVIGVTALSTAAMVVYPALTVWLGLDDTRAGIFIGATIHDVAQVVGAGYSLSTAAGDAATITKLMRVALLMPVLLCIALGLRAGATTHRGTPLLPWFTVAFALLMLLNSTGVVPSMLQVAATQGSQACLVVAIAAVGLKTSLRDVASLGWRPVVLAVLATVFLAGMAALYLHTLH